MKDLSDFLTDPPGWEEDDFGLVYPKQGLTRWELVPTRQWGLAVFRDGTVLRTEDGRVRKLEGLEAIQARAELRSILGEEIADAAGIEPE